MIETTPGEVVALVRGVIGEALIGAYLHGSAVLGGLQPHSDIDVLAVTRRPTTDAERRAIVARLFQISGQRAWRGPGRSVELTIVVQDDVRPWRMPPRMDLLYGEWLRDDLEAGMIPSPTLNGDLAAVLTMALRGDRALAGPPPAEVLDPVPVSDLRRAVVEGIPGLLSDLEWDTRNVLLTLARIWTTVATGEIRTKDAAATWALERLPPELQPPLAHAREAYLGREEDRFAGTEPDVRQLADRLVDEIERAHPA